MVTTGHEPATPGFQVPCNHSGPRRLLQEDGVGDLNKLKLISLHKLFTARKEACPKRYYSVYREFIR